MGAEITIDKHTTPIDEWLDIDSKLQAIDYQQQVVPHISAWKFFVDELNPQEFNCIPIDLDLSSVHQLLSPHQVYLMFAIRNDNQQIKKETHSALSALIHSIKQNIEQSSARTPITQNKIDAFSYQVYAYLGKLSKPKLRLIALSYALKLESLLNSKKKLAILSGGGVLRNKKLQKGSTLPLIPSSTSSIKELPEYTDLSIFSFYWQQEREVNPLLAYPVKRDNPFIVCQDAAPKVPGIKPPLLKLSLKPYEEVSYSAIEEEQQNGEIKFDIRVTARHELKMEKFEGDCTEIMQGVFVAGEKVAKSWEAIEKYKIKGIINCAGDYCENWFQDRQVTYLTYFLKDSQNENIECLFYRSIDFIQQHIKSKQNILIHCIQGISRSVTIVIAYIIFKMGSDYKKAEQFVKQKRGIACPNNGFMVELIQFHKRLYETYDSLPSPRVFLVSSHSKETPNLTTARLLKHPLFDQRKYVGLDCRGIYIIQTPDSVFMWVGSKCEEHRLQQYWTFAQDYIKKLQKYEKASNKTKAISQGTEGKDFLELWNLEESPPLFENPEYNNLFYEGEPTKPGGMRKFYESQNEQEKEKKKKLFVYPDFGQGLGVFSYQDLGLVSILVSEEEQNLNIFVCKDRNFESEFEGSEEDIGQFLDNVIQTHYQGYDPQKIVIEEEKTDSPSKEFLQFFS